MNNRQLLEHILEEAGRLADSIRFECGNRSTEWLDEPAVRRIEADAKDLQEAVIFVKKRLPVSSKEDSK